MDNVVLLFIFWTVFIFVRGEENVALRKTTTQSSTYYQSGSSLAVDGNTDNDYGQGSCSHTDNYGINWWCVDLQRTVDFHNIKIYNRNTLHERLKGFEIRLSSNRGCDKYGYEQSTVCYKDTSTTTQNIYTIEQCNQQNTGQFNGRSVYISVENPENSDKYLTLCEVEIYESNGHLRTYNSECPRNCKDGCNTEGVCNSCITGYYGDKCLRSCPINCKDVCQQNNGNCNSGGCITGYYGDRCSSRCSTNCKDGCRQDNGDCINGCKPGWKERRCSSRCERNCIQCEQNGVMCTECKPRYWGNQCQTRCGNCNNGCQKSNGNCIGGCKPRYSGKSCKECISGYWGNQCQTRCGNCNNGCRQDNGYCNSGECISTYYGDKCSTSCPTNCNNGCQKSNGNCNGGCKRGFWGLKCKDYCNRCSQGCQQNNGDCNTGGCISGYYGNRCSTPCPTNCNKHCVQSNGDCVACKDGYWEAQCYKQCPTNCIQSKCNKNNGHCTSCKNKYWGENCDKECSTNCKYKYFDTCYKTSGKCNAGCKETWYGDTCNNKCSSKCKHSKCYQPQSGLTCTDGCIDGYKGTYCTSCKTGWYGDTCQTMCNGNCINGCNQSTGRCTSCIDGYYGQTCSNPCPNICQKKCDQDSGHCDSCKSGTFGTYCNETCSPGCLPSKDQSTCDRDGTCIEGCIDGRYGTDCNTKCSTGCKNGTCQRNGHCNSGCIPSKSGSNCNKDCSTNCTICNQDDVKNCLQCYDGYYGQSCQQLCSKTCQVKDNNPVCNQTNGYCNIGCINGYYSDVCNKECSSNCLEKICNQNTGLCTNGCVAGKLGDNCTEDCHDGSYGVRCNSTCGNCYNHTNCHIVSGACGQLGCQSGFQGPTCKTAVVEETVTSSTIIAVVFVIVIVIVVALVAVIYYRKQKKNEVKSNIRADIVLSTAHRFNTNDIQYNSLQGNNGLNVEQDVDGSDIEDNQALIYQNIDAVTTRPLTSIKLPDLWDYSQYRIEQLTEQYQLLPKGLCRPHAICLNDINGPKNRYKNVCAFDDTRVKLEPIDNDPNSDYINACYITMYAQTSKYIASQGPNEVNMNEFIRMIWDVDASKIVMLTNLFENAIEKCKKYWPDLGKTIQFGQINMKLIKEDVFAHFTIREIQITKEKSNPRIFRQYHYTSWPDKDVPSDIASLVEFRNKVNKSTARRPGPMIVHCSAGVGRTGTFLALDYLIQQAQAENSVDIFSCVSQMRQERVNMVQTLTQYILLHDSVTVWYLAGDTTTSVTNYTQIYNQLIKQHSGISSLQHKYQLMNKISCKIDKDGYSDALLPENTNRNRDKNVLAANSARLMLVRTAYENSSDYINAVHLPSYRNKRGLIATQTPLPNTLEDFWLMVLQSETQVVISLEDKKTKNMGEYIPKLEMNFGDMTIKRGKEDKNSNGFYDVISLQISQNTDDITRTVKVYQCHFWKGQNKIPESSMSMLTLLDEINSVNNSGPLVVTCLNGATKSGVLCVLAAILERLTIEQDVNIIQTILQLRVSRPEIINSFEQFKFCFDAVGVYLDYFANYANSC